MRRFLSVASCTLNRSKDQNNRIRYSMVTAVRFSHHHQERPLVVEDPNPALPDAQKARAQLAVNLTRNRKPDVVEDYVSNAELGKEMKPLTDKDELTHVYDRYPPDHNEDKHARSHEQQ